MKTSAGAQLAHYLAGQGLKSTRQRNRILEALLASRGHLSAEELYLLVKKADSRIGYATVYRTLKLLTDAGLAHERRFADGVTRFEQTAAEKHHDHLICTRCGKIIEFENQQIEKLQKDVAKMNQFTVQSHKLELYGLCEACQTEKGRR
jgi:Fur family ferric uptake transcriptional regulator